MKNSPHLWGEFSIFNGEKLMKKIEKTSELMWLFGVIFVALGVAVCSKTNLGVSMIAAPAFIISEALVNLWQGFSVGVVEYLFQGVLLLIMCVIVKKFKVKYIFAFLVAVIYGYTLNLFIFIIGDKPFASLLLRWIMLIVGDTCTAFGVACFFKTYMPLQVYELFVSESANTFQKDIHKTKQLFDISLLCISVLLTLILFNDIKSITFEMLYSSSFHSIGLGTIVTTLINSPIIAFWSFVLDKIFYSTPLFSKLDKLLNK